LKNTQRFSILWSLISEIVKFVYRKNWDKINETIQSREILFKLNYFVLKLLLNQYRLVKRHNLLLEQITQMFIKLVKSPNLSKSNKFSLNSKSPLGNYLKPNISQTSRVWKAHFAFIKVHGYLIKFDKGKRIVKT
jgi:hypothetical protein